MTIAPHSKVYRARNLGDYVWSAQWLTNEAFIRIYSRRAHGFEWHMQTITDAVMASTQHCLNLMTVEMPNDGPVYQAPITVGRTNAAIRLFQNKFGFKDKQLDHIPLLIECRWEASEPQMWPVIDIGSNTELEMVLLVP